MNSERKPPLDGVRVLDLTRFIAGPYCTMLLADQGAEVVKVEPLSGEETRALEPMLGDGNAQVAVYFLRFNRSKKSICLELKSEEGQRLFERLVHEADVLIENFRPGVLERLGFGWSRLRALNERLVYCSITGFGHSESPFRDYAAFTPIVEATAGTLIYRSRDERPTIAGYPVGDIYPAALASAAIAMALYRREADGLGARIDMAMYDAMISMNERAIGMSAMLGDDILPGIAADLGSAPSGVFRARDGFMSISVVGERIWRRFCHAIGREDWLEDERLASGPLRAEHFDSIILPGIEDWLADQDRAGAVRTLTDAGVPAAEVARPAEIAASEQARTRDMIIQYPAPRGVVATVVGNPMRFDDEQRPAAGAAPAPGEHTREVLRSWVGLEDDEIGALLASGVVRQDGGSP
ncbi:MAG: CoA transferase [Actinomycetota bacterium]